MRSGHDIEAITIPFLPRQVRSKKLHDGLVLDKSTIEKLKASKSITDYRKKYPSGHKKSRKRHKVPLSIIVAPEYLYAIFCQLGAGNEGKVKWIQNLDTGAWAALKVLVDGEANIEFNVLNSLDRLVKAGDNESVHFVQPSLSGDEDREYFIMKANPGISLYEYIINHKNHPIFILNVALNILHAGNRLQKMDAFHGDLKPENIMINPATGEIELIDFGFFRKVGKNGLLAKDTLDAGTPKYMAPELWMHVLKSGDDTKAFDHILDIMKAKGILPANIFEAPELILSAEKISMYSIGIMLNELFLLTKMDDKYFISYKKSLHYSANPIFSTEQLNMFFGFLKKMQAKDPEKRPTYEQAIDFFNAVLEKSIKTAPPFNVSLLDLYSSIDYKDSLIYLCISKNELEQVRDVSFSMTDKKNALVSQGYTVADTAFVYTSKEELAKHIQMHYQQNRFGVTRYYDGANGEPILLEPQASPSNAGLFSPLAESIAKLSIPEVPSLTN
ncbi:MAG: protein kinase [Gammaproteobacteria bacterium]